MTNRIKDFEYAHILPVEDGFTIEEQGSAEGINYAMVSSNVPHDKQRALEYLERETKKHWIIPLKWVNVIDGVTIEKHNPHFEESLNKLVWLFVNTGNSAK